MAHAPGARGTQRSVWVDLVNTYNSGRLVVGGLAAVAAGIVGVLQGWPRGPWILLLALFVAGHASFLHSRHQSSPTVLLVVDGVVIAVFGFLVAIPTVALLALASMMVSTGLLERTNRVYLVWLLDVVLMGVALALTDVIPMPAYTATERAMTEAVSLLFFATSTVAMSRLLVSGLRRTEFGHLAAEQQLSVTDARYRAMLALSSDGIAVTDAGLRLVELGVQNQRITGYPAEDRVGGSMLDLVVPDDRSKLLEAFHRVVKHPAAAARFDCRIRRKDGEVRWMSAVARNLLDDPDVEGFVFNFHDVTELEEARRALESGNERLEELIRSKSEFVAAVSHELRTPLTAVVGLADLLEGDGLELDERAEFRGVLAGQARQAAAIVNDLLVAARLDAGEIAIRPESCSVRECVEAALPVVARHQIRVDVDSSLRVEADPVRFQQVVRNLVSNAERHGGSTLAVQARKVGNLVVIGVEDDGPGVPLDDVEAIFEPYRRAGSSDVKPGSIGLGLSVARSLARMMSGDVVYRRVADSTVFELSLPVSVGPAGDPTVPGRVVA